MIVLFINTQLFSYKAVLPTSLHKIICLKSAEKSSRSKIVAHKP